MECGRGGGDGHNGRRHGTRMSIARCTTDAERARFQVFAFLFALAAVLYHRWTWFDPTPHALPLAAAVAVLLKPSSTTRLLILALLQAGFAFADLPDANTNRTLTFFLSTTVVCGWIVARRRGASHQDGGAWLRAFAPPLCAQLLVVYFWACWHKLNTDFIDIETSCGVTLYTRVVERVPFLPWPTGSSTLWAVVTGTILVEALIPILLVFRRTRLLGIALSVALHFGCGLTMFYDFSITMMAVLFLFTPPSFARDLIHTPAFQLRERLGFSQHRWALLTTLTAIACAAITQVVFWDMFDFFRYAWWTLPVPLAYVAFRLVRKHWTWPRASELLRMSPLLAVIPCALFINGMSPYLGWKTETSFAMYSNLRTEGGRTNHLLLGAPLTLFPYQTDLVRIESSSDPEIADLADAGYEVPFYELRRRVAELTADGVRGIAITFERAGVLHTVTAAEQDPEISRAPSFVERKLLRFRTILPYDANSCSH